MLENGAFYSARLYARQNISGTSDKFWSTTSKGEKIAYLDRLIPFVDYKILLRYDEEKDVFMFNKVMIHKDWIGYIERLYVFSGEDTDL